MAPSISDLQTYVFWMMMCMCLVYVVCIFLVSRPSDISITDNEQTSVHSIMNDNKQYNYLSYASRQHLQVYNNYN